MNKVYRAEIVSGVFFPDGRSLKLQTDKIGPERA